MAWTSSRTLIYNGKMYRDQKRIARNAIMNFMSTDLPPILLIKVPPRLASSTSTNFPFDFRHVWHASRFSYFVNFLRNYRDFFHSRPTFVRYHSYNHSYRIIIQEARKNSLLNRQLLKIWNTRQNWKLRISKNDICRLNFSLDNTLCNQ